jgi:serine/threonine protein kinase
MVVGASAGIVVHRDVKPANILVRPDGKVRPTPFPDNVPGVQILDSGEAFFAGIGR